MKYVQFKAHHKLTLWCNGYCSWKVIRISCAQTPLLPKFCCSIHLIRRRILKQTNRFNWKGNRPFDDFSSSHSTQKHIRANSVDGFHHFNVSNREFTIILQVLNLWKCSFGNRHKVLSVQLKLAASWLVGNLAVFSGLAHEESILPPPPPALSATPYPTQLTPPCKRHFR